jgi:hypothetical protein
MQLIIKGINLAKRWASKIGIPLGFMAATAVGILGGIDAALMFPSIKLPIGLIIGGSNCFVNAVSYFYVVTRKDPVDTRIIGPKVIQRNTAGSTSFAVAATFFIGTTFVANFVGMYIGFTVLGGKLDLNWPEIALQIPGAVFGVASAVSGLFFNIKVAHTLWNKIRQKAIINLPASERPLLIQVDDSNKKIYLSTTTLKHRLNHQVIEKNIARTTLVIDDDESNNSRTRLKSGTASIKPTFFTRRSNKLTLPITAFVDTDCISRHKRSNSM